MLNNEILECQKYLHPETPVSVTSEDIKPFLKELGWSDGDDIPSGMQEYTTAVLHILGKPVSMRSLPVFFSNETVITTLKSALNKVKVYKEEQDKVKERVKDLVPNADELHPDTVDAVMELAEKAVKEEIKEEAKLDHSDSAIDGFSDVVTPLIDKSDSSSLEDNTKHLCPRCLWDQNEKYEPYPVTEADKLSYAYSILGGTPFSKSYVVANGLLEITYTMPNTHVSRLIEDQVKIDTLKDRLYDTYQFYVNNNRYGLAASLTKVRALKGVDTNPPIPDFNEERFKHKDDTNLYKFTEYIEENIIKSSVRERYFRDTYMEFVRLNLHLMHTIDNENFSEAVLDGHF